MPFYRVQFHGRKIGAIGIMHPCVVTVESPSANLEDIRFRLYDTHDHITGVMVITEDTICPDGPSCPEDYCREMRKRYGFPVQE
jgi:hypothetical protein